MGKTPETANCTIGEGSVFSGKFYVNGSILIEGKFQGDIKTDDELIVGPTGKVKTDIRARRVTIAGTLIGNIKATEEVNLVQTGKVLGDISTPRLNVEQGVVTEGKVTITSENGVGAVSKIIKESFGSDTEAIFTTIEKEKDTYPRDRDKDKDKDKDKSPESAG